MADDQEKTEEPSQKKIDDARKEGNVPKSQDVSGLFTLFIALLAFLVLFPFISEHIQRFFIHTYSIFDRELTVESMQELALGVAKEFLLVVIPLATTVAIAGILGALAQFGFLFTTKPLVPDLKKIDPIKGLKNLLSLKKLLEGVKITLKAFVTLGIAFIFFSMFIEELPTVALFNYKAQLEWLASKALIIALIMLIVTLIFALADIVIVRYQYFQKLKMSKQEVKDEMKQMEGDPLVKQKIRQIQMQASRKRMMADVPNADVVITNPTHYAVALKYDATKHRSPIVLAKGMNQIALKIKEIARENGVHIAQNPPLARALYKDVDIDQPIPEELFAAVAEVLSYVYTMNKKT
ncbi:MAG: flagellar biosynthesis protein FlhB [Thiovulaceae bacterium]|nr:flagellar biosynthesis protein FlhB [Sulfurimonadaceae bacterium]